MTFGQSIKRCFSRYCDFSGRASRSEYWWWMLFSTIVGIVVGCPAGFAHDPSSGVSWLAYLVSLFLLLPSWGVLFRRLHDTGRSGWWWLINLIPVVGNIILIVFCIQPSEPYENKYGFPPAD